MKQAHPERIWTVLAVASVAAAVISAAELIVAVAAGSLTVAVLSVAGTAVFAVCAATAWLVRSETDKANRTIHCLRLKKQGLDIVYDEDLDYDDECEILPKGKMPDDRS